MVTCWHWLLRRNLWYFVIELQRLRRTHHLYGTDQCSFSSYSHTDGQFGQQ